MIFTLSPMSLTGAVSVQHRKGSPLLFPTHRTQKSTCLNPGKASWQFYRREPLEMQAIKRQKVLKSAQVNNCKNLRRA